MIEMLSPRDPLIPERGSCVLADVLAERAREAPDRVLVRFADGTEWTRAELLHAAQDTAAALHAQGTRSGDHVLLWLPNGPEAVRTIVATSLLGAPAVPVSTAYRSAILEHV